jgi:hypothetical protein
MKHAYNEMGAVRGTKTMLRLNQKNGFDCPGCCLARSGRASLTRRVLRKRRQGRGRRSDHKARHARVLRAVERAGFSEQSDFWLGKQGRLTHPMILREASTHYEPIRLGRRLFAHCQ